MRFARWVPVVAVVGTVAGIGAFVARDGGGARPAVALIPSHPIATTTTTTTTSIPPPVPLAGQAWSPAGRLVSGQPAVYVTTVHGVGVARLDTSLLRVIVYAGTQQPAGAWTARGSVAPGLRPALVASFNGGFQFGSAQGGFFADGREDPALRDGAASLVTYPDGHAEVVKWGRDVKTTEAVAQVRQNLTLLVDGGLPTPQASSWGSWGATLVHNPSTWRSAIGSDFEHHLFFVGGPGLTPTSLAEVMTAVGAQRAMELDINPQWVFFNSYTPDSASKLLPAMNYPPEHVLTTDWRDFVAAFART